MIILGAVAGGAVAVRQVLLHIVPGSGAYGNPFLGLHFYTWDFIISVVIVIGGAVMLMFDRQFGAGEPKQAVRGVGLASLALFLVLALGNGISTVLLCGGGLCPDNPTGYLLLK